MVDDIQEQQMLTKYEVFSSDPDGQTHAVREIRGSLRQKDHVWEMHTEARIISGSLTGDPLAEHVFTDLDGFHYRVV